MKCACESEYSFPCQFPEETEFFSILPGDIRKWCRFHQPLRYGSHEGFKSLDKDGWEAGGKYEQAFRAGIAARLSAAKPWKGPLSGDDDTRAHLKGVAFPPGFDFSGICAELHADFTRAIFDNIRFHGLKFGNDTSFNRATFEGRADFSGTAFGDGFDFSETTFGNSTDFSKSTFGYGVRFTDATFGTLAGFTGTRFADEASFYGATFGLQAVFNGAKFGDRAVFTGAKFGHEADFHDATFGNQAGFYRATFGHAAVFNGVVFGDRAVFTCATFGDSAGFTGATFGDEADFHEATFGKSTDFSAAKFSGSVNFATSQKKWGLAGVNFSDAIFTGACRFDNRSFGSGTNFNGAVFKDLVEFHGCEFHPGMSFHQTKFLKTKEDKLNTKKDNDDATERLERSYRTLKLEMEKLRARNEEADFFALEMECRRQRGSVPWFERFAATAYKHLSGYGRSVDLPLIWLLVLAYAAHYLYLGVALIDCNPGPGVRLAFTLEQMFRPFYVWAKSPPGTGNCLVENSPLIIPILASLQSLATIGLLTLFLLALRRRFKMD